MKRLGLIAFDQYGTPYPLKTKYPRKELCDIFGVKSASKMYIDPDAKHIGYIVAGHWLAVYSIGEWK